MAILHEVLVSHLVGGAAILAIQLAAAAKRRGIECKAWVTGHGPAAAALDTRGIPYREYDLAGLSAGGVRQVAACLRMVPGFVAVERPLVHVHNPLVYSLMRPALRLACARVVVHFHIEPTAEEIAWTLRIPPDHIVTCANYIAVAIDAAQHALNRRVPVTAVPNAIEVDKFSRTNRARARAALGLGTDRFVVLMLANLAQHKGQATAIRATASLFSRGVPAECWLVGEDRSPRKDFAPVLHQLCAELGVTDRVRFLGFRTDAAALLDAADAFLLPSTLEGLPLSVLEAQAARVPVVGSTIPGVAEVVVDGKTGFLVPAHDAAGYADRLEMLFRDPSLRDAVTERAAATVASEHSWNVFENRIFDVYRHTLTR